MTAGEATGLTTDWRARGAISNELYETCKTESQVLLVRRESGERARQRSEARTDWYSRRAAARREGTHSEAHSSRREGSIFKAQMMCSPSFYL
ncbi:hypothetical protein NL676_021006 [Syzygium grande]|nr:hypothetical protein NL676_021006 [Syzygium grande]